MTGPRTPGVRPGPPLPPQARPHPDHLSVHRVARPDLDARRWRGKPESNGVRMILGLAGLASASALTTAMLPSILPQQVVAVTGVDTAAAGQQPDPSVIHVTHVITLAPGQSLPPDALAAQSAGPAPAATPRPTPRIIYQTITRQSGKP